MTRMEEYQALRAELETAPDAMETVAERALTREKTCRKKRQIWGVPAGSLAACFALFLLLVNCFPTFAAACEGLPVLGELAEALRFDKSLRLAVPVGFPAARGNHLCFARRDFAYQLGGGRHGLPGLRVVLCRALVNE